MDDGGMGGLLFLSGQEQDRRFGAKVAEAEFVDTDGIKVSVALNIDNNGMIYELDFWKIDFSQLQKFPSPKDLVNIQHH